VTKVKCTFKTFLRKIKRCPDCNDPIKAVVLIEDKHGHYETIGVCQKHWEELADSDLEFPEKPKKK
jgi:hypothetical protein